MRSSKSEEKEWSLRMPKAHEQPEVSVEISAKTTKFEVDCWRVAHSRSASEEETTQAAIRFFRSLRQRNSRYLVRELGLPKNSHNAGV
jgi:hypothetical protein